MLLNHESRLIKLILPVFDLFAIYLIVKKYAIYLDIIFTANEAYTDCKFYSKQDRLVKDKI